MRDTGSCLSLNIPPAGGHKGADAADVSSGAMGHRHPAGSEAAESPGVTFPAGTRNTGSCTFPLSRRRWVITGFTSFPLQMPDGPGMTAASGKLYQFRHPVRLFWPKSKCYDYLYQEAEALLKNFPIQATISFYEDSDSEDEIEDLTCEN
ncbi:protein ripply2 isoform 2 [Homo sapiens]|nr:protein ripply2 isoform 2 [Homo sapiens]